MMSLVYDRLNIFVKYCTLHSGDHMEDSDKKSKQDWEEFLRLCSMFEEIYSTRYRHRSSTSSMVLGEMLQQIMLSILDVIWRNSFARARAETVLKQLQYAGTAIYRRDEDFARFVKGLYG